MGIGSLARFIVGLVMSAEIIRHLILGRELSGATTVLSIIFIVLSASYFVQKLFMKT